MKKTALESSKNLAAITTQKLRGWAADWVLEGELQQLSPKTLFQRRLAFEKLFWFMEREGFKTIGVPEFKAFFLHLTTGHTEPGGRFGNPKLTQPLRPISLKDWHTVFSAWFRWLQAEGYLESNLMERIPKPQVREEIKRPLSDEQTAKLIEAARHSTNPLRDTAIVLLLDSGLRASELVGLKAGDVDLQNRSFKVTGKGNKIRHRYLGRHSTKALSRYMRQVERAPQDYLFQADRGCYGGTGNH
ncbi:MAG: tyrosine-type recombinase/integrase [Armatimonadota bacterium]|nr:tyrosine-type recombinase/integrase [Armatimonadota bacterium]